MPLLNAYHTLVERQELTEDTGQIAVLVQLQALLTQLEGYAPPAQKKRWFSFGKTAAPATFPRGVYIWGGVGRGKSMLMDLFFQHVPLPHKRRVHFHAFMMEIHAELHAWRQQHNADAREQDPIPPLARRLARDSAVLCLDEFQVTDVADAVILSRLFGELLTLGVVVITTSNLPPGSLYRDGLQRELFLKFVALVEAQWDIIELASPKDYRLQYLKSMQQVYVTPLGGAAEAFLETAFASLTCHAQKEQIDVPVSGRTLALQGHGDVAWSSFSELCEQPLGAGDYLEIAREFHTLLLSDIPLMPPEMRNEAARFVKLIDALYDHRVKLICTAAAPPEALYTHGDTAFEFQRTASRLAEMQSEQYFASPHIA